MTDLYSRHSATLAKALDACEKRYSWTAYPESPSRKIHGEEKPRAGKARFEAMLGADYPLCQPGEVGRTGAEVSPYTGEPLGISYPEMDVAVLYEAIQQGMPAWRKASAQTRIGVCLEILDRCAGQLFENAHATMHTSGQSYIMAFAGSGANALDRGLEALAYAHKAMADVPATAQWERQFGKGGAARLEKDYRLMPRGVGVVVCCATFPLWNGYPALCASLATGNPVVLKPHPSAILPDATSNARERGAITSHVYSVNEEFLDKAVDAYHEAGASVACNLVGMPINFAAAYSDYHVTGLNPAGNACLADLAFVSNRFRIVQSKRMV